VKDVDDLVEAARTLSDAVLRLASELLATGVSPSRVQTRYVAAAFELLEEVETRAVLASGGDAEAIRRLGLLVGSCATSGRRRVPSYAVRRTTTEVRELRRAPRSGSRLPQQARAGGLLEASV
jgi:hypothetical protein